LSRFTSTKVINTRWRNNDFVGAAGSTHTFPDAFHEEFLVDWALQIADGSVVITETPTTGVIQMSSLTVGDITLTGTATGNFAASAQATVYLVRNNTASTILKGTLVSATGAEPSGRIDIAPFSVTGLQDSELRVMGIATENIGVGVNGTVMSFGTLTGLDTRGTAASALAVGDEDWDEGTILYAHPTVPGKLTEVRPQHDLAIAFTTVRHQSTGQIAIRIVPGNFHLEWMHDVAISSVTNGQALIYDSSASVWTNQTITSGGGGVGLDSVFLLMGA
jgi:hypothetical protein